MNASNSSLRLSGSSEAHIHHKNVKVSKALPSPQEWILVNENNMEKRAPCEIWRSGVNKQLSILRQQLLYCKKVEEKLEVDMKSIQNGSQNRDYSQQ